MTGGASFLHSIYGRQLSTLPFATPDPDGEGKCRAATKLVRPKSSPVERQRASRPHSAIISSAQSRPTSACPSSSRQQRIERKIRPKSAVVGTQHANVQTLEAREEAEMKSLFKDPSTPVYLTRVPEYFNFWAGKPLLSKEHGVSVQTRKKWQRPKSDYGTRFFTKRNGSSFALGAVLENDGDLLTSGCEIIQEQKEITSKHLDQCDGQGKEGTQQTVITNSGDSNESTDLKTCSSKDNIARIGSGLDKNDLTVSSSEGHTNSSWKHGANTNNGDINRNNYISQKWNEAQSDSKVQILEDEDGAIDYFKKDIGSSALLDGHMYFQHSTRFELPLDIKSLEAMNPMQYLYNHCIVSSNKKVSCARVFTPLDSNKDFLLSRDEVLMGLIEVHHHCITIDQAKSVIEIVQLPKDMQVDLQLFSSLACLTERMFSAFLPPTQSGNKEVIETVDFEALEWKLKGCSISLSLRTLFAQL